MNQPQNRREQIRKMCQSAIERVDIAIERHAANQKEDLSVSILGKVRSELLKMQSALSSAVFKPTYPRFILDWPDESGLIRILSDLAYEYERMK